jgi:23S rRNA (pseudouridine1915-N3)-methyltransferase
MFQVKILAVGRPKELWIEEGMAEFIRRLSGVCQLTCTWVADETQLIRQLAKERQVVLLDPQGRQQTSEEFAHWMDQALISGGSRLTFAVGGAEGLSLQIKQQFSERLSLSRLTYTHQLARLILAEQIYRAFEIRRGSPYHR